MLSASRVRASTLTLGLVAPLEMFATEAAALELCRSLRARRSSSVKVLGRDGRNGAGEPAREVRNYSRVG